MTPEHDDACSWIHLRGLDYPAARVGVLPAERQRVQALRVDVGVYVDTREAAAHDDVGATLDWSVLYQRVGEVVMARHYGLIETLAETLAQALLAAYPAERLRWVRVEVHKPGCLPQGAASVVVLRRREATPSRR